MWNFIKGLFGPAKPILDEKDNMKKFLIAGLGNIGSDYEETRHNIGFKILDLLSAQENFTFNTGKLGAIGSFTHRGRSVLCLKPSTYMNLSGKAVNYWLEQEKIPLENLLVVTDDINLPYGTVRLKAKGSDGGHNGLRNIQHVLQTSQYNRFRFGVGANFSKGKQVNHVLGKWTVEEGSALPERLNKSANLIRSFILAGAKNTMNQFNGT